MNIGFDFDGVIVDTERAFKYEAEKYQYFHGGNFNRTQKGFVFAGNPEGVKYCFSSGMFERVTMTAPLIAGAKEILEMLHKDGHKLFLITARGTAYADGAQEISTAKARLEQLKLPFDKIIWAREDKGQACLENKIDIFIDDDTKHCENVAECGIRALHFRDRFIPHAKESKNITEVDTFMHIYKEITAKN